MRNSDTAKRLKIDEEDVFWRCFDALPKPLRAALSECSEDFSAVDVYEDYIQRKRENDVFRWSDPLQESLEVMKSIDAAHRAEYRREMASLHIENIR